MLSVTKIVVIEPVTVSQSSPVNKNKFRFDMANHDR